MPELVANELTTFKYTPELIVGSEKNTQTPALTSPFLIPIYQRLYTWETEHVERLLLDLWDAYKSPKSDEYFIGALVTTIESDASLVSLELIDGQQRLTTLWLIASVLVKIKNLRTKERWKQFLTIHEKPRLSFSGRDSDIAALEEFVVSIDSDRDGKDEHNWLSNESMINARKTITLFFNGIESDKDKELEDFSDYIWKKASFVITQLHPKSDKERFFDTMNSRGIQLEKHEILKSHLLTNLPSKELKAYGKVWDLCADIDGYIPGNLQTKFNFGLTPVGNTQILSVFEVIENQPNDDVLNLNAQQIGATLEDILKPDFLPSKLEKDPAPKVTRYKSPVSFPVFLLHVLRVFAENNSEVQNGESGISLDDKKLIETFKLLVISNNALRKGFIECLFECRLLLDNFIIKGQLEESSEHANWEITSRLASSDISTRIKFSGNVWGSITMLQSMMHFSPMNGVQRATWLSQALKGLRAITVNGYSKEDSPNQLLEVFKKIDFQYANNLINGSSIKNILQDHSGSKLGTNVHRYWFYKLEYCLWELWFNQTKDEKSIYSKPTILNKTTSFRMRSVNSIEHVSPQSENNGKVTTEMLDNFGNLALISVSENSSYSDKDPLEKKSSFVVSYSKGLIQSLKLAHLFNTVGDDVENWNDTTMREHEELMIEVLTLSMVETS